MYFRAIIIGRVKIFVKYIYLVSICHNNNNLSYVLCIVNVYQCSVNGILNFLTLGLTSFSSFRCARLVFHISRLNCWPIIAFENYLNLISLT